MVPPSILTGEAAAGEAVFKMKCASCHSVSGDLKGLGAKVTDPKMLQNVFIMPSSGGSRSPIKVTPTTVTVTLNSGAKIQGRLLRIDDFIVTLLDSDGWVRSFRRDGDQPAVEVHDPLQAHRDLLPTYSDKDIHNLTSYLVTLK
jgi:hypothetical protein